jgi:multidrug efflux system outer membrane protein
VSYLNADAERSVLQHSACRRLDGERARATVNLIRALGGGWTHGIHPRPAGASARGRSACCFAPKAEAR